MRDPLADIRSQLIKLCGSKKTRDAKFTPEAPCDFRPGQVGDPTHPGEVFTEAGAWLFIVDLLESGHPIEEITLEKPPGRKGYVMITEGVAGRPAIYIKLQLGSGRVRCRSCHESTRGSGSNF